MFLTLCDPNTRSVQTAAGLNWPGTISINTGNVYTASISPIQIGQKTKATKIPQFQHYKVGTGKIK